MARRFHSHGPERSDASASVNKRGEADIRVPQSDDYDTYVSSLEADVAELTELVASNTALLERANERAAQARAELETTSKRIEAAATKELEQRTRKVLEGFLFVVDDLDRAIEAAVDASRALSGAVDGANVVEGLELVRRNLLHRLGQFGVTRVASLGEVFDPGLHDAMSMVSVHDATDVGRVVGVIRAGYQIGNHVLRPAGVAIGRRTDD